MQLLDAALSLAGQGWHVFPCSPKDKKPLPGCLWKDEATDDAGIVRKWWTKTPDANIGIALPADVIVIDDDTGNAIEKLPIALPPTLAAKTGKGTHYFLHVSEPARGRINLLGPDAKMDVKANGGYVLAAPSIHPNGKTYEWLNPDAPIAECPPELLAAINEQPKPKRAERTDDIPTPEPNDHPVIIRAAHKWMMRQPAAVQGENGSAATYRVAIGLVEGFGLSEQAACEVLWTYNEKKCEPEWSDEELCHKLDDAMKNADPDRVGHLIPDTIQAQIAVAEWQVAKNATRTPKALNTNDATPADAQQPAAAPPPPRQPASNADPADLAAEFLAEFQHHGIGTLRFWRGCWWRWQDGAYRETSEATIQGQLVRSLTERYTQVKRATTSNATMHVESLTIIDDSQDAPCWLDDTPPWPIAETLATRSALINLPALAAGDAPSLTNTPTTPKFFSTNALEYDLDPDAPMPKAWLAFLNQLWPDDQASIDTLQEWIGYLLTADTRQQKILLMIGPRRSGKGTIARIVRELIGRANVAAPTLASLATNFGLWPLMGKTAAIIADARLSGKTDQGVVVERLLTISGEDAITIDRKYMAPATAKLTTRIMILSNELPRFWDASRALAARFVLLRLTQSFLGHEDHDLTPKLLAELPGILIWAVEGWRRLNERGRFIQPATGEGLVEQMEEITSPVSGFLRDRCVVESGKTVFCGLLYQAWTHWSQDAGREPGTAMEFGRQLVAACPSIRRCRPRLDNGSRKWTYEGITTRE